MNIDAMIAEATAPLEAAPEKVVATEETQETEANESTETEKETEAETKPKELSETEQLEKLRKQNLRDQRRIGKLTAQKYEAQKEAETLRSQVSSKPSTQSKPIQGEDEPYDDYIVRLAEWKTDEKLESKFNKFKEESQKTVDDERRQERIELLNDNDLEAKKVFSDYTELLKENEVSPGSLGMSPRVMDVFLEAEHGAYALYALLKEEAISIAELNTMSESRIGMIVGKMEDKGLALSKLKTETKAPRPITPAKGTGMGGKSLDNMSYDELKKEFKL